MEQAYDMAMGGSQEKDNKDGRVIKWKMHGHSDARKSQLYSVNKDK